MSKARLAGFAVSDPEARPVAESGMTIGEFDEFATMLSEPLDEPTAVEANTAENETL